MPKLHTEVDGPMLYILKTVNIWEGANIFYGWRGYGSR